VALASSSVSAGFASPLMEKVADEARSRLEDECVDQCRVRRGRPGNDRVHDY
jgi:hypothetical protein